MFIIACAGDDVGDGEGVEGCQGFITLYITRIILYIQFIIHRTCLDGGYDGGDGKVVEGRPRSSGVYNIIYNSYNILYNLIFIAHAWMAVTMVGKGVVVILYIYNYIL